MPRTSFLGAGATKYEARRRGVSFVDWLLRPIVTASVPAAIGLALALV
jgi:hypothetical protein